MNHYPYLHVARGRLLSHDTQYTIHDVTKRLITDTPLYLLDTDGIATNRPNYNTFQRLSSHADLWIDAGPRSLEDLVDIVMAGATAIILRTNLWSQLDTHEILDITDCTLYAYYEHEQTEIPPDMNGLILPYNGNLLPQRPLQHSSLPAYLLNLTDTDQYPHDPTLAGVFLDFPTTMQEEHHE